MKNVTYIGTRDKNIRYKASEAILKGICPDGGLFIPEEMPVMEKSIEELAEMDYRNLAYEVMSLFFTDFTEDELRYCINNAYDSKFDTDKIAPVVEKDGVYFLELFHGKTIAFKDMALSILPYLLTTAAKKNHVKNEIVILTATSGDTGKAALEGFRDVDGTKIVVFYPSEGVSDIQKLQMITQEGKNVFVSGIEGNFDDAQTGVKKIFTDEKAKAEFAENGCVMSSANSINWGRLVPQIVYYVSAYCDMAASGEIKVGEDINVCVPTGNFGNIFAAYLAREMGLPLGKLICASNSNCVLTDFIESGEYDRTREFYKTMSPSMDILVSSNLERLLYVIGGPSLASSCMNELSETGKYKVPYAVLEQIHEVFQGYFCSETETAEVIRSTFEDTGYLTDPHTAAGLGWAKKYIEESGDSRKIILASTANPYKFPADVLSCLGIECDSDKPEDIISTLEEASGEKAPAQLTRTLSMPVRFDGVVDSDDMISVIFGN